MKTIKKKMASQVNVSNLKSELKFESSDGHDEEMETDNNLEEGEISSDGEEVAPLAEAEAIFNDLVEEMKENPAKRFDLIGDVTLAVPKEELDELYASLGIEQENERHYRFNTINMRNTEDMKTEDIIEYFSGLEPAAVDWLEEGVCNIQWDDEILPARALLYLSIEIKNSGKKFKAETEMEDSDNEEEDLVLTGNFVNASKLKFPLPSGRWRKGNFCDGSKNIIMRYANKDDKRTHRKHHHRHHGHRSKHGKKPKHKEVHVEEEHNDPWGSLAQSWGRGEGVEKHIWSTAPPRDIPDLRTSLNDVNESRFAEVYLRHAAEQQREKPPSPPVFFQSSEESEESEDDYVRRRKLPKMHADREEEKQKLARLEAVAKSGDLRSRLNHRKMIAPTRAPLQRAPAHSDESGDELSTDWATENYGHLKRTMVNREDHSPGDSLASDSDLELGADEPGELLQIEIDNEYCQDRPRRRH